MSELAFGPRAVPLSVLDFAVPCSLATVAQEAPEPAQAPEPARGLSLGFNLNSILIRLYAAFRSYI